jgi:hypothetical protein
MLSQNFKLNYYHKLNSPLFSDIPEITEITGIPEHFDFNYRFEKEQKIINSWIGQNNFEFLGKINGGCTFENHLNLSKEITKSFDIEITNEDEFYLPEIFENYLPNVSLINENIKLLKQKYKKLILISNGDVLSQQSYNFDFEPIIEKLSNENSNFIFIVTKPISINRQNILDVNELTKTSPDLLQIGYLSKYCDVIVGRASGPYCFAQNKSNLLDSNKTFVAFCNNFNEGKFYQNCKSKFLWSSDYSDENIYNAINSQIN